MNQTATAETSAPRGGATGSAPEKAGPWAWGVCWLMFAATALCYMDRQALALVGPQIRSEFRISHERFGWIMASFSMAYALCHALTGYCADRWNVRRTYAAGMVAWSVAGVASGAAPTVVILMTCHALLGLGESCNWPCASRVTEAVLPRSDRGLGSGIYNAGASIGAVLTPLTVPLIAHWFSWRVAFSSIGALGFVWVVAWLWVVRGARAESFRGHQPERGERLSVRARAAFGAVVVAAVLAAGSSWWFGMVALWLAVAVLFAGSMAAAGLLPEDALRGAGWSEGLGALVRRQRFWVLVPVSASINLSWHFLVNWMPTYLQEGRGLSALAGGMLCAIPFLAAGAGNLIGGWASMSLARRGLSPSRARLRVMAAAALVVGAGAGLGLRPGNAVAIVLLALMALGSAALMANFLAFNQDVCPRSTGLVVGLLGGIGNLLVAGALPLAGRVNAAFGSLTPAFVVAAALPAAGWVALWLGWDDNPAGDGADGSPES